LKVRRESDATKHKAKQKANRKVQHGDGQHGQDGLAKSSQTRMVFSEWITLLCGHYTTTMSQMRRSPRQNKEAPEKRIQVKSRGRRS
jgi:hypothetical protein